MKYSEIKPIIQTLHAEGWRKYTGVENYRKVWKRGNALYAQQISVTEITSTVIPIENFLAHYERKAMRELRYAPGHK
ncbi:hypothetical protein ACQKJG_18210 [Priestia megaterium]|uniref:hypothetical protein n=1 Tax=Priestia megaterium TaxID=1404 RepID=UPI003CFC8157